MASASGIVSETFLGKTGGKGPSREHSDAVEQQVRGPNLDAYAPPWRTNPSSWRHRIPICVLATVGFFIATYLALYQWRLVGSVWDPVFGDGSEKVLDSQASETMRHWIRMPDAALGALGYLADAIYGLAGSTRRWQYRPWMVILFGFDVIPLGVVSAILVVIQGTVVGSWCFLCIMSAIVSVTLIPFAVDEVWSTIKYLGRVWRETRSVPVLWRVFWGIPTARGARIALQGPGDEPIVAAPAE